VERAGAEVIRYERKESAMKNPKRLCNAAAATLLMAAALCSQTAQSALYYGGDPKGLPGEAVSLTLNAAAGTTLDALDLLPDLAALAGRLTFVSLDLTPAFTDGGTGFCNDDPVGCSYFFLPEKEYAVDTLLATLNFLIPADAPVGPIPFDPGVFVGDADALPIPVGQGFEVLAIPEPASVALLLAGLLALAAVTRRAPAARPM
jgi:hypothetical protein